MKIGKKIRLEMHHKNMSFVFIFQLSFHPTLVSVEFVVMIIAESFILPCSLNRIPCFQVATQYF